MAAWLIVCAVRHSTHGFLEAVLAWCLAGVALITGAGVVLGETGGFGPGGFLLAHALVLAALLVARRTSLAQDRAAAEAAMAQAGAFFRRRGPERILAATLALAVAALTVLAAGAEPAVADALTYHLPRIGHWLQERRIDIIPTADARMNFVAVLPDVMMAWLVGGTREGFGLVVLAQAIGGIMAVAATIGLARHTGLSRVGALLAGALLLGMANVAVQFTAAQTDLFTTGIFAASFYLWLCALRRGSASILGAAGAGLALGAKGTLFYLAPGAMVWTLWLAWQYRMPWPQWRRTLVATALGIALFAGPAYLRNVRAYSDPLGPEEWVRKHHQGFDSIRRFVRKLGWNLTSALAQNFEPHSQPHGLQAGARRLASTLAAHLPERDPYTLDGRNRRATLQVSIFQRARPDADVTSFGVPALVLFLAGSALAVVRWRQRQGQLVVIWSGGVIVFVVFFHAMQQWHPFGFRYLVLVAPWLAIVSAWGIGQLPQLARWVVWTIALAAGFDVAWHVTTRTHQSGWCSVVQPWRSTSYFVAQGWREWSQELDRRDSPFGLALPEERPLAAFYRQPESRPVGFVPDTGDPQMSAEQFVQKQPGWVIVPASRFIGREGHVAARVWLFAGSETNPFSVAAYRRLATGETPSRVLYRHLVRAERGESHHDLLVKTWSTDPVCFTLANPGRSAWRYETRTPLGLSGGELAAGATASVGISVDPQVVTQVVIRFMPAEAGGTVEPAPRVSLAMP